MNETPKSSGQTRAVREFIGRSFWVVGSFCFLWETLMVAALYRATPEVELPLLGKCTGGEALILTLTFFWPVLLALHWIVHIHQSLTRGDRFFARFPGVLGDKEIPTPLARFRVVLFVLLLLWPTTAHVLLTVRGFTHTSIVYNVGGEAYQLPKDSKDTQAEGVKLLEYRGSAQLGRLKPPEDAHGKLISGEWRWLHWRDKKEVERPAESGRPPRMAVKPEHWPTALPIIQPWGFLLVAAALAISTVWLVARAWRRK